MASLSSGTATVTGTYGTGDTATAIAFANVQNLQFDLQRGMIYISYIPAGGTMRKNVEFELDDIATITYTVSSNVATITIST